MAAKKTLVGNTTPVKYKDLRRQTSEDLSEIQTEFETEQSMYQLDADISATKKELNETRQQIFKLKRQYPLVVADLWAAQKKVIDLERSYNFMVEVRNELF